MRERSAAWRCCAHSEPPCLHRAAGTFSPQFWCSDASLSSAATGTVRLHASSHARGLKLFQGSPRSSTTLTRAAAATPLVVPGTPPMPLPCSPPAVNGRATWTLQLLHLISRCLLSDAVSPSCTNLELGSDTALRYFSPLHKQHTLAQHLCVYRQKPRFGTALLPFWLDAHTFPVCPCPVCSLFLHTRPPSPPISPGSLRRIYPRHER